MGSSFFLCDFNRSRVSGHGSDNKDRTVHGHDLAAGALRECDLGAGLPVQTVHADPARKAGLNVHKHNALLADGQRRAVRDRGTVRAAPTDEPGQHQAERNGRYNGKNKHLPAKADIKKADQHGRGSAHRKPDRDKRRCGGLDHDKRHDGNQP